MGTSYEGYSIMKINMNSKPNINKSNPAFKAGQELAKNEEYKNLDTDALREYFFEYQDEFSTDEEWANFSFGYFSIANQDKIKKNSSGDVMTENACNAILKKEGIPLSVEGDASMNRNGDYIAKDDIYGMSLLFDSKDDSVYVIAGQNRISARLLGAKMLKDDIIDIVQKLNNSPRSIQDRYGELGNIETKTEVMYLYMKLFK